MPFGRVPELSPEELWARMQGGKIHVVDVRSALEHPVVAICLSAPR